MATVTLSQSGTANANMRLQVTYTAGSGTITINSIAGARTDGYDTMDYGSNTYIYCNIAGTTYTLTPSYGGSQKLMFAKNSNYATFWSGSQSKSGMSGSQTVIFTFSSSDNPANTNIVNSKFIAYIDAGTLVTTPTLSSLTIGSITRTSAAASFTVVNNGGAAIVDSSGACSLTNYGTEVSGFTGTSGTFSSLTPNTTYYARGYASNGSYSAFTNVQSFTTTGNAPNITAVSTTPTIDTCDFDITVAYDTNDAFSSRTIEYGTTTSYGSSVTGTEITGLDPNTKYYYKITVTSTKSRTGTYTGDFTTLKAGGKISIKVGGTWKEATPYIKVGGSWKEATPYIKVNGTWKEGV